MLSGIKAFYSSNYKKIGIVPLVLFVLLAFLAFVSPGVPQGIDLAGGTLIIVRTNTPIPAEQVETLLAENFELTEVSITSISSPAGSGITIKFGEDQTLVTAEAEIAQAFALVESNPAESRVHAEAAMEAVAVYLSPIPLSQDVAVAVDEAQKIVFEAREKSTARLQSLLVSTFNLDVTEIALQRQEVSPTLGATFYATAINVAIFAVILLVIIIFLFFREMVPSIAVIASAVFNIVFALALMAVFNVSLSLVSIPALLMLIGYSIDTDILLATRILKGKEGTVKSRVFDSARTGLTMTFTSLAALIVMATLAYFTQILVLFDIAAVLVFGLFGDLISTWLMNAPFLSWYAERKEHKY
jgi:preprotein translocase subunit SecF